MGNKDKSMIRVNSRRFEEIFRSDRYNKVERVLPEGDYCSMTEYDIEDTNAGGRIVGYCTDTSWENAYEVVPDLCDYIDITEHYNKEIDYLKKEKEANKRFYDEKLAYYKLPFLSKLKYKYKEWQEYKRRKKHPGLLEFTESSNIIMYNPSEHSIDTIMSLVKRK